MFRSCSECKTARACPHACLHKSACCTPHNRPPHSHHTSILAVMGGGIPPGKPNELPLSLFLVVTPSLTWGRHGVGDDKARKGRALGDPCVPTYVSASTPTVSSQGCEGAKRDVRGSGPGYDGPHVYIGAHLILRGNVCLAHARRATFVLSILSLAPSLSSPWEVPQVDRTRPH